MGKVVESAERSMLWLLVREGRGQVTKEVVEEVKAAFCFEREIETAESSARI